MAASLPEHVRKWLIDPSQGWSDRNDAWPPLAFVELDRLDTATLPPGPLPPFPVVGIGDPAHPLATTLDVVVEPPISAESLLRQVQQAPHTAATLVQLLRATEGLPLDRALTLESMCYGLLQGSAEHAAWLAGRSPASRPPAPGQVLVERRGGTLHVILDRPHARNAIDRTMRDQLADAFTLAALDRDIETVKLSAVGSAFSMGGDLDEFGTTRDPVTAHLIRSRVLPALALARRPEIVHAYVQGGCVGAGLEIAAFAARVTASANAWFQLPEVAMGVIPGAGGCVSIPRRVGRQRAALLMLSGRRINAATALRWGLIDAIEEAPPADEGGTHVP